MIAIKVSIPDRVLGFFRLLGMQGEKQAKFVSIPDRVLGFFRPKSIACCFWLIFNVSIPDRVLGFFRQAAILADFQQWSKNVSIPDRVLGFFRPGMIFQFDSLFGSFNP